MNKMRRNQEQGQAGQHILVHKVGEVRGEEKRSEACA